MELDLIVDGKCFVWCEEGREVVGVAFLGLVDTDCVIREANRESVFTLSVDAHIEIGRMQMRNETGWVAWGCNGYGCVCLKKQSNSFEYIGTTG